MELSSVVKALGSLCLLLVDGFPVSQDGPPEIIGFDHIEIKTKPGRPLVLHCDAFTNCEDGVTLIYWLVNDSFPDEVSGNDRIVESEESTLEEGAVLQRSLLIKNVTSSDVRSTFTCVVTNAVGVARKDIKLVVSSGRCPTGKKQKTRSTPAVKSGFL